MKTSSGLATMFMTPILMVLIITGAMTVTSTAREAPVQGRDHVITGEFGDWRVRHYFDQDELVHRFSDAKSRLLLENDTEIEFQINRRRSDERVTIILPGWYEGVTIKASGRSFQWGPSGMHTFFGEASPDLLSAIAQAQEPIVVHLHYGQPSGIAEFMRRRGMEPEGTISGTVSHEGSAAALRWIRLWP